MKQTIESSSFNYQLYKVVLRNRFWRWLAFKLPPTLVYHAAIRLVSWATVGEYGDTIVPELPAMEAIGRWERGHGIR